MPAAMFPRLKSALLVLSVLGRPGQEGPRRRAGGGRVALQATGPIADGRGRGSRGAGKSPAGNGSRRASRGPADRARWPARSSNSRRSLPPRVRPRRRSRPPSNSQHRPRRHRPPPIKLSLKSVPRSMPHSRVPKPSRPRMAPCPTRPSGRAPIRGEYGLSRPGTPVTPGPSRSRKRSSRGQVAPRPLGDHPRSPPPRSVAVSASPCRG